MITVLDNMLTALVTAAGLNLEKALFIRLTVVFTNVICCCQDALAPYKHIEEDLKSLKEVLEMKNQQIHQQDLKISELEKIVGFNFLLLFRNREKLALVSSCFICEVVTTPNSA